MRTRGVLSISQLLSMSPVYKKQRRIYKTISKDYKGHIQNKHVHKPFPRSIYYKKPVTSCRLELHSSHTEQSSSGAVAPTSESPKKEQLSRSTPPARKQEMRMILDPADNKPGWANACSYFGHKGYQHRPVSFNKLGSWGRNLSTKL
jgi:hypothetical protein